MRCVLQPSLSWTQDDSDFELEPELPPLDATIPKDVLKKLKPKEKKRQDVINGEETQGHNSVCVDAELEPSVRRREFIARCYLALLLPENHISIDSYQIYSGLIPQK